MDDFFGIFEPTARREKKTFPRPYRDMLRILLRRRVYPLVVVQQAQVVEHQPANVALELYVRYRVLRELHLIDEGVIVTERLRDVALVVRQLRHVHRRVERLRVGRQLVDHVDVRVAEARELGLLLLPVGLLLRLLLLVLDLGRLLRRHRVRVEHPAGKRTVNRQPTASCTYRTFRSVRKCHCGKITIVRVVFFYFFFPHRPNVNYPSAETQPRSGKVVKCIFFYSPPGRGDVPDYPIAVFTARTFVYNQIQTVLSCLKFVSFYNKDDDKMKGNGYKPTKKTLPAFSLQETGD